MRRLIIGMLCLLSFSVYGSEKLFSVYELDGDVIVGKMNLNALRSESFVLEDFEGRQLRLVKTDQIGPTWLGEVEGFDASQVAITNNYGEVNMIVNYDGITLELIGSGVNFKVVKYTEWDYPEVYDMVLESEEDVIEADVVAGEGEVIQDILIAYTTPVRTFYGTDDGARAAILNAVNLANKAYVNSGVNIILNPVSIVHTAYVDSGAIDTDLSRFTGSSDGYMD